MSFAATIALAALVQTGIEWAMMNNATIRTSRKVVQRSPLGPGIVVLCVRWYLSYKLSYRDLVTVMSERGIWPGPHDDSSMGAALLARVGAAMEPLCPAGGRLLAV